MGAFSPKASTQLVCAQPLGFPPPPRALLVVCVCVIMVLDAVTSVLAIITLGYLGTNIANALHLPRVVPMILFGILVFPFVHPSILWAPLPTGYPPQVDPTTMASAGGPCNPASEMRTAALLIALARGGLALRVSSFRHIVAAASVLSIVPYALELCVEVLVAPWLLPASSGMTSRGLYMFLCASVWAPLSVSIVVPNMLHLLESGLSQASRLVLIGAPLEVSTALLTEGVLVQVLRSPGYEDVVLAHIPVYVLGSVGYGFAFALLLWALVRLRSTPTAVGWLGPPQAWDQLATFLLVYCLCYGTSCDGLNTPWLIGYFAALCCAMGTQHLQPQFADAVSAQLKPVWAFAECFLFVLTGCAIRPALDDGHGSVLFGRFLVVLVFGQVGRMLGDVVVAVCWQCTCPHSSGWVWNWTRADAVACGRRCVFVWVSTVPKATIQATLGPKVGAALAEQALRQPGLARAAMFVGPASAVAILYMATLGSVLTNTVGVSLAKIIQDLDDGVAIPTQTSTGSGASSGGDVTVPLLRSSSSKKDATAACGSGLPPPPGSPAIVSTTAVLPIDVAKRF